MASARVSDRAFGFEEERIEAICRDKPWTRDPRFFKKIMVSASAAIKMVRPLGEMRHAQHGVEAGLARKESPVPIEVMGLMVGHCDPDNASTIVVTDAFPLPVEGTETSVMADDPRVSEYMAELQESLEKTRKDRICGWYHSHPFEVGEHSNCFFSAQDISSQYMWQTQFEDMGREGDPFCGIVVDPLRSLAKGKPELGAFHCYPQDFTPEGGVGPDGEHWASTEAMQARWGPGAKAYYMVPIEIFQSTLAQRVSDLLARDFLWMRVLSSTPMLENENKDALSNRLQTAADKLAVAERSAAYGQRQLGSFAGGLAGEGVPGGEGEPKDPDLHQAAQTLSDASKELCEAETTQVIKYALFNHRPAEQGRQSSTGEEGSAGE